MDSASHQLSLVSDNTWVHPLETAQEKLRASCEDEAVADLLREHGTPLLLAHSLRVYLFGALRGRHRGWAVDREEGNIGVSCIAAPLFGREAKAATAPKTKAGAAA